MPTGATFFLQLWQAVVCMPRFVVITTPFSNHFPIAFFYSFFLFYLIYKIYCIMTISYVFILYTSLHTTLGSTYGRRSSDSSQEQIVHKLVGGSRLQPRHHPCLWYRPHLHRKFIIYTGSSSSTNSIASYVATIGAATTPLISLTPTSCTSVWYTTFEAPSFFY
jgi:hypothetical protein